MWTLSFLFIIGGAVYLQSWMTQANKTRQWRLWAWMIFIVSFLIVPLIQLSQSVDQGKRLYTMANVIKNKSYQGRFSSNNPKDAGMILGYLTGMRYEMAAPHNEPLQQTVKTAQQAGIDYFFFFYQTEAEKIRFLKDNELNAISPLEELCPGLLLARLRVR
jgi:hypothetical protein